MREGRGYGGSAHLESCPNQQGLYHKETTTMPKQCILFSANFMPGPDREKKEARPTFPNPKRSSNQTFRAAAMKYPISQSDDSSLAFELKMESEW